MARQNRKIYNIDARPLRPSREWYKCIVYLALMAQQRKYQYIIYVSY